MSAQARRRDPLRFAPASAAAALLGLALFGAARATAAPLATSLLGPSPVAGGAATASETTDIAKDGTLRPTAWLAIEAIDGGGRRPFRPDRVFRDHVLQRDAAAPVAGGEVTGENGSGVWTELVPDEPGSLAPSFRLGWATTTIEAPEDGYYLARMSGIDRFYLDGSPHFADRYAYGFGGVPVFLTEGAHRLYVTGLRGRGKVSFVPRPEGLVVGAWDAVAGDLVLGKQPFASDGLRVTLEVPLLNLSSARSKPGTLTLRLRLPEVAANADLLPDGVDPSSLGPKHAATTTSLIAGLPVVAPLAAAALRFDAELPSGVERHLRSLGASKLQAELHLVSRPADDREPDAVLGLKLVEDRSHRRVVFESAIEGSLQEYALVPPTGSETEAPLSMVLSLHGASVGAMGQARAYAPKDDFAIAAPLNRRPFGFDWQDWGRTDAYEALADSLARTDIDPERVFVTGHSMGGHGTWHLAANDPDRFLAAAPSAGWSSFDSYGGRPDGELASLWQQADSSSQTLGLISNLAQQSLFVLHGTADDNVPLTEAELMLAALAEAGAPEPAVHFEEGAGHWWGNRCVDWPGIFELFRERAAAFSGEDWRPEPHELHFRTVDPSVDSKHFWVEVLQARNPGEPVEVHGWWDESTRILKVDAGSAAALRLEAPDGGRPIEWRVDGATFAGKATMKYLWVVRGERGEWVVGRPKAGHKTPELPGNFKRAFGSRFVLVYGTAGDDELDLELFERARFDLQNWSYRAGGEPELWSDEEYLLRVGDLTRFGPGSAAGDEDPAADLWRKRNVILYGSRDSNAAWTTVLGDTSNPDDASAPIDVTEAGLRFGETELEGEDLVALFLRPHASGGGNQVGVVGVTGAPAARLSLQVPYFVSGVGLPDWTVFDAGILGTPGDPDSGGDGGVLAAGWFANDWTFARPAFVRE
ncbi:MAG: prolyl oligopeptidase family serine peptidase [Planctomycetota bacterium]|nr:prolyl oligopeptidase family serine peptidase [Planctomycetota bacterium]